MSRATQVTAPCTHHGEGPYWDPQGGRLLLVDMLAGAVLEWTGDGDPVRHDYGGISAVIRRRTAGGFVLAVERGIRLLDDDLEPVGGLHEVFDDPALRMNEGGCDPQGRLYVGSMAYAGTPGAGTLWRFDPDGSAHPTLRGVTISNGLQWHADGRTAYYNDTPTGRIARLPFDPDTGCFGESATLAELPDGVGMPDGMAIDADGGIWVALWGGSAVWRYDGGGRLTEVIDLPTRFVTACTFGGPDLRTLYVTTSRDGWGDGQPEPEAGAVFAVEPGVRGAQPHAYAG